MGTALAEYVYAQVFPWPDMLRDLYAAGYTDYRIGKCLGCDHSTVEAWGNGSEPRHSFGQALIDLHERVCGVDCGKLRRTQARVRE